MPFRFLSSWWDSICTSLWFVPGLMAVLAIIISFVVVEIDQQAFNGDELPAWIFAGSADGARSILSTIASSVITIAGVLFSITIVVLQQASTQFTPRVMGNFIRQTGVQLVLGTYIATFLYSLLVLRYVRGEDSEASEFIPRLGVIVAIFLAIICMAMLVYFIHHMATQLQVSMVIKSVDEEFSQDVQRLYPEHLGEPTEDEDQPILQFRAQYLRDPVYAVQSTEAGYVLSVDDQALLRHVPRCQAIAILPQIGRYVTPGMPLVELSEVEELTEAQEQGIRNAFDFGPERSRYQDPLFSIRQLVDIALKAMSPGVNDPTTAKNSISMLGGELAMMAERVFPDRIRLVEDKGDDNNREIYVWTNRPAFDEFVEHSFSEIRRISSGNVSVTAHLVETIGAVGYQVPNAFRAQRLHHELNEIERSLQESDFSPADQAFVREKIVAARQILPA